MCYNQMGGKNFSILFFLAPPQHTPEKIKHIQNAS